MPDKKARLPDSVERKIRVGVLRAEGLSAREIGETVNLDTSNVYRILEKSFPFLKTPVIVNSYRAAQIFVLEGLCGELARRISAVLAENNTRIPLKDLSLTFGVLFDKIRLLRGESTSNVANLVEVIRGAHRARQDTSTSTVGTVIATQGLHENLESVDRA